MILQAQEIVHFTRVVLASQCVIKLVGGLTLEGLDLTSFLHHQSAFREDQRITKFVYIILLWLFTKNNYMYMYCDLVVDFMFKFYQSLPLQNQKFYVLNVILNTIFPSYRS